MFDSTRPGSSDYLEDWDKHDLELKRSFENVIHQTVQHLRIPFSEAEISLENLEELGRLWKMELEGVYEHGQPPPAAATLLDNIVTEERMEANEIPQVDGMDGNSSSDESYVPPSGLGSDSSNTDSDNDDLISVPDLDGDGGGGGSDLDVKATVKEFQKQDLVPVINAVAKNFKASTKGIKMEKAICSDDEMPDFEDDIWDTNYRVACIMKRLKRSRDAWKLDFRHGIIEIEEVKETSAYYERLLKEAPFSVGDHGISPKDNKIPWLDNELVRKGQDFVRRNFFSVMLAHFVSLMMIFTFKSGRAVLLRTGESHRRDNSTTRYLSTVLRIKLWYESDFAEYGSDGGTDVYAVRKIHGAAARSYATTSTPKITLSPKQTKILHAVRTDLSSLPETDVPWRILHDSPSVPMSQFDMVVTQFCFLGFIVLHPGMFGIWKTDGIEGFIHIWAVLGRLLGIEDKFNLALHFKDKGGYEALWKNIFLPDLKGVDEAAILMWDSLVYGLRFYTPFLRLKPIIYFIIHDVALVTQAKGIFSLMATFDKFSYFLIKFVIQALKWNLVRMYMNIYQRAWIYYAKLRYMRNGTNTYTHQA